MQKLLLLNQPVKLGDTQVTVGQLPLTINPDGTRSISFDTYRAISEQITDERIAARRRAEYLVERARAKRTARRNSAKWGQV